MGNNELGVSGPSGHGPSGRGSSDNVGHVAWRLAADYLVVPGRSELLIPGGAIDIGADGRIVAAGAESDLGPAPDEVTRVSGVVMPGLINVHAHTPMTLVRSAADGLPLAQWLQEGVWPLEGQMGSDDARAGMLSGSIEMLLNGITTSCEMYLHEEAVIDAITQSGSRCVVHPGIISALAPGGDTSPRIAEIVDLHRRYHNPDSLVTVGFGPHSVYDLSPEQLADIGVAAAELDAVVQIHLEETQAERELVIERHGRSATQILADSGVLDGRLLAAHGVWLSDEDAHLLVDSNSAMAHCPESNLKLGSGIARVADLRQMGLTIGIGTDGPASNDDLDLWSEMRMAVLLARGSKHDSGVMSAADAIEMATIDAAKSLALSNVGAFEPGYFADVIRVDLQAPAFQPLVEDRLLTQLVFAGSPAAVTDVWVAGNQVVADNRHTSVDIEAAHRDVTARAHRLIAEAAG